MFIKDRQAMVQIHSDQVQNRFFPKKSDLDTVKIYHEGKKSYLHFFDGDAEEYATKRALRRTLSCESGGAWVEEEEGKTRYFIEEKGWVWNSIKEVSKEEYLQKERASSTLQKVIGVGLGIMALFPGAFELMECLPFSAKETGLGLLSIQQKNPIWSLLGGLSSIEALTPIGQEFRINNFTLGDQLNPQIAGLSDGGAIVVWESNLQDANGRGIYGQVISLNGSIKGGEFRVNNYTDNAQSNPSVTGLSDDGFVVTWQSYLQDGSSWGIYAQRFDGNATPIGLEIQVNTFTADTQQDPAIVSLSDGSFLIVWESNLQDGDLTGIYGQFFDMGTRKLGGEFQINTYTTSTQLNPSATVYSSDQIVVVWQSDGQDGDGTGIFGQRLHANGTLNGAEFQVNTYTTGLQSSPKVSATPLGGFAVFWESYGQDGDLSGVYGQAFDANGMPVGSEFQVNSYTISNQRSIGAAVLSNGQMVVAWESDGQDGNGTGVYGQEFNSSLSKIEGEFQVNNHTMHEQTKPSVGGLLSGDFIIVWQSLDQLGDLSWDVFGQRWLPTSTPMTSTTSRSESLSSTMPITSFESSSTNPLFSSQFGTSISNSTTSVSTTPELTTSLSTTSESLESFASTSILSSTSASSNTSTYISIQYGQTYEVYQDGVAIGTFVFSGGDGSIANGESWNLSLQFTGSYYPEDGDSIVLFYFSEDDEVPEFGTVDVELESIECLEAEGNVNQGGNGGTSFEILFKTADSCLTHSHQTALAYGVVTLNV